MSPDLLSLAIRPNNYIFIPKRSPESWKAKCKLWHQVQHREETIRLNWLKDAGTGSTSGPHTLSCCIGPSFEHLACQAYFWKRLSKHKDLKLAEIKKSRKLESDEGTSASKNVSCQLSPSWSSCSASSCTRCREAKAGLREENA